MKGDLRLRVKGNLGGDNCVLDMRAPAWSKSEGRGRDFFKKGYLENGRQGSVVGWW